MLLLYEIYNIVWMIFYPTLHYQSRLHPYNTKLKF
jgi:hypothetical protein